MAEIDFKKLQNGSDIRGVALEGVAGERPNLTAAEAEKLAAGFVLWLSEKTGKKADELKVSIGRDPRLSGEALLAGAVKGMLPWGTGVYDCGLASTPAMFMSTVFPQYACDGAVMITASHLPFNRNGFKFFDRDGGLNKGDIAAILTFAETGRTPEKAVREGTLEPSALMEDYSAFLRDKIKDGVAQAAGAGGAADREKPLAGLKITVDAGNGAGGFYAEKVLAPLGADVSGSQFLEPDGRFPNHAPNPEDRAAIHAVSEAVRKNGSDFGLIFDTDVDRSSAVDQYGREINRNGIVAMAAALVAEEHPGTTVVTDSITSDQLTEFLEVDLGLRHRRFKRGYKNVINEAIRLNAEGTDCQLAIETSGHAALAENYFLDDGAYLAAKIVIKAAKLALEGKKLDSVIAGLTEPAEAVEVRFPILAENFGAYGDRVLEDLMRFVKEEGAQAGMTPVEPNYEGVRISFDKAHGDGWCLLRKSLHDPIMPLNIESNEPGGCGKIADVLRGFLAAYGELDTSKLC